MCQNLKILSPIIQLCILLRGSMTQGEIFFLSAVVLIKTLKYLHLKSCISPFPPSGYKRKELQRHWVCSFPKQ